VLSHFAHEKLIYEDKEYHNAVFVGLDEKGVPRHAHKRGTRTQGEAYKGNVEGSDPKYSFHRIGKSNTLYVFEAPVDMLSFITLHPKDWKDHSYVTLDGVAEHAMLRQLKLNPHLKSIVLCLDHDEAGIEAVWRLKDILHEQEYEDISVMQSQYKDWNEDLKARHGITPIPASEHPKLALLPRVCAELLAVCEALRDLKDPDAMLRSTIKGWSLCWLPAGCGGKRELAKDCLQCMAADSLLVLQKEYRQMERPVTMERLVERLQNSYRPHQDRGWLRTRAEDIRSDLADIGRQVHATGIRTLQDREKLLSSYMRLALDCVKTRLFVELEAPLLVPVREQKEDLIMTM
jgi:hypothetical protein